MNVLNENEFPNKGWQFRQPQTGWTNPMAMVGFKASVLAIVKHRMANKAVTAKHNLSTDPDVVAEELRKFTRLRLGIPEPASFRGRNSLLAHSPKGGVVAEEDRASFFRQIARAGTGLITLGDWLGHESDAVPKEVSESRAAICATCPRNQAGDLLSFFTKPASEWIRRQLEERKQLKLATSHDEHLGICDACGCPLKLKVHTPLKFITDHMKPEETKRLDERCWILNAG